MNKNLLAIAVGAAFVIPGIAHADVKVYGRLNVGFDTQKDELGLTSGNGTASSAQAAGSVKYAKNTWSVHDQNNSSRLGFKGDTDLGIADLKAIFQLEYGVNPFGSESVGGGSTAQGTFTQRNIFVGLQGGFGTIKAGRFDTPLKLAGEKVDQFNDQGIGDDTNLMSGESRINNIIQYSTPKFADLVTVNLAIVPGQGRTAVDDANSVDKGIADTYYASVVAEGKSFYATLSYAGREAGSNLKVDRGVAADGTGGMAAYDVFRVAAGIKPIADLELGALYQQARGVDQDNAPANANASELKDTSYLVSAAYSISAFKLKAEYGQTRGELNDVKRNLLALGVDYKLNKAFTTQLYYIGYEDKNRTVTLSDATAPKTVNDPKTSALGVAVIYNF